MVEELASEYQAIADWSSSLPPVSYLERIFTIDLQERLVDHGRPVVFSAELADVRCEEDGVVAVFEPALPRILSPSVYFRLSVPPDRVARLLTNPRKRLANELVVVARIRDIVRPAFSVGGYEGFDEYGGAYLEVEASGFFIAQGDLLDYRSARAN